MDAMTTANGTVGLNYCSGNDYDTLHNSNPNWKLYGSETASAVNSRGVYDRIDGSKTGQKLTSYDNSAVNWGAVASRAWYEVIKRDFVAGEYVWTGFDYIGEPTPWNGTGKGAQGTWPSPKNSYFGIIDTAGFPKDSYYFYQSQWNDEVNTLHILPAWNEDAVKKDSSGKVPVVVYTDAKKVELFFTDAKTGDKKSLGTKEFTQKQSNTQGYTYQYYEGTDKSGTEHKNLYLTWQVPYKAGTISAVAYGQDGQKISEEKLNGRTSVTTTGEKKNLKATVDRDTIAADGADLTYVTVDVTDKDGNIIPNAEDKVSFKVEGEGTIVNLTANMELNELTLSYTFAVNVFPRNYKGDIQEAVQEYINSQDSEQKKIFLPENISGEKISYYKSASKIGKYIPIVAFIMCVAVFFLKDRDLKSEVKKRNIQLQSDYPEILSKILLYSNAGLSIKSSIERIVRQYEDEKKKNPKEYHYAYEELKMATVKMKSGVSEINAINQYGERCGLHNYIKLANIIEQNIRRGTGELSFALENELNRALVERKNTALKRGSEISTKLLGPMTVMLIVALVILMVPALMSINM